MDAAARREQLKALSADERASLCTSERPTPDADPAPIKRVRGDDAEGVPDRRLEPMSLLAMVDAAAGFGLDDTVARKRLAGLLGRWAKAGALLKVDPTPNAYYSLDRALLPVITGWALVREAPEVGPKRRKAIDGWLGKVLRQRAKNRPVPGPNEMIGRNNHAYLAASVTMAWAALKGDAESWAKGPEVYREALQDMRADGSLPAETARGARALWYQRHAIASLVVIAEMARRQGVDLYGLTVDGKSLHDAVRFLLDAIERPGLVEGYAAENHRPGLDADWTLQDLSFLQTRGHDRHYMAWAEIYIARFGDRPEAQRLEKLLATTDPGFRPMLDDYSGGDTTCFFYVPGA